MYKLCRKTVISRLLSSVSRKALLNKRNLSYARLSAQKYSRCFTQTIPQLRNMGTAAQQDIGIEELKELQQDKSVLILDVREKEEILETGILPGAVNIPLGEITDALKKSPEEFKASYHKPKPDKDTHIVFSCRSGKRSLAALSKVKELGYTNLQNFSGGWLEWEKHMKN